MSNKCLNSKLAQSLFSKEELARIKRKKMTPEQIEDFVLGYQNRKVMDVRQGILQARAVDVHTKRIEGTTNDVKDELNAIIFQDRTGKIPGASLEHQQRAIMNKFHSKLYNLMHKFRPTKFGFEIDAKGQANLVRAISGENINDPDVTGMAAIWNEVFEDLRIRFNKAGGNMPKPKSVVALPMNHDPLKVEAGGFTDWHNFIKDRLDTDAMDVDAEDLIHALRRSYQAIVTEGTSSIKPGKSSLGKNMVIGNRHQEESFLKFKTADDWIDYNSKYGNENIYASLTDHVTLMSKEIGAMELLGPNPDLTIRYLRDVAIKKTGNANTADRMVTSYDVLMGNINPKNKKLAHTMSTLRNIETALKLPSALLSALPDTFFNSLASHYNGMPIMNTMKRFIGSLSKFDNSDKLATQLWLGFDHAIDAAHTASRFSDVTGQTAATRLAEGVMRVSGLNHWTIAGKQAFGIEMMATLARDVYEPNMLKTLKRYKITPEELKGAATFEKEGVKFIDLDNTDPDVAHRISAMVSSETRFAVPEPDVGVRSMMTQGTQQGTFTGELLRTGTQFKSFPMTIIMMQLARGLHEQGATRTGYLASMLVGTTLLGALSVQMKELSKGREAVDWDNPELWKKGFLQGGSLGLIGDMVFTDVDSFGSSLGDQLIGPVGSDFQKYILKGLLGVGQDVASGEVDDAITNAKKLGAKFTGDINILNRLWYTRIIMQRAFQDNIDKLADPNWHTKQNNIERARREKFDNPYWYPPK